MELIIAHLTDIHIRGEGDLDILTQRGEMIGKTICSRITDPSNSLVIYCITGDFSYSGKEEEYIVAELFIETIIEEMKKNYQNIQYQLVFVPGNHDCDFDDPNSGVRTALLNSRSFNIKDNRQLKQCTQIQKNFFSFAQKMKAITCSPERIITAKEIVLENSDLRLVFHCINSSWCSEKHEQKGKMKFYSDNLPDKSQNDIVFTLMHHDAKWLDWEDENQWEEYYKKYSDVILVGHDHRMNYTEKKNYDSSTNYHIMGNQLYDTDNPDQSGFNILKINTNDMTERFFSYSWEGNIYKKVISSGYKVFERNQYNHSGIFLNKTTRAYLDTLDIDIKGKNNKELRLSDVFAFPTLKVEKRKGSFFIRDIESAADFFEENKKIVIKGHKEYGKTALLKRLFRYYFEKNRFPVFINVSQVTSADDEYLNDFIESKYLEFYENIQPEEIALKAPAEKVCFIDDFDNIRLSDRSSKLLLQFLTNKFGIIVITRNLDLNIANPISYVEMNTYLDEKFEMLSIRPIGNSSKDRLVKKWLMLDEENQMIDPIVFEERRRKKYTQIQTVMQNNFFNRTPMELLLILSYLDQDKVVPINYSKYSYIYETLIMAKLGKLSKNNDSSTITIYKTILQQLAYHIFNQGINGFIEEQELIDLISRYKKSYSNSRLKAIDVVQKLTEYQFLENTNDQYCFRYNYMYYYFAANHIANLLAPEEKKQVIDRIFNNLIDDTYYNIALFLLYSMNKEYDMIPIIRELDSGLLTKYSEFSYEDFLNRIKKWRGSIKDEVRRIYTVPKNEEIPEIRQRKYEIREEKEAEDVEEEEISKNEDDSNKEEKEVFNDALSRINSEVIEIQRLVDFSGNLLKNYSGELKNESREEIISIMIHSGTKIIGGFCEFSQILVEKVIGLVLEKIQSEEDTDIETETEIIQLIKRMITEIWFGCVRIIITLIGKCLECDIITDNINNYVSEHMDEFTRMIRLEYLLETMSRLPVQEIEMMYKGKNKMGLISQNIMKNNIYWYLSNYQYNVRDKQTICSVLGFNIKDVTIEEKKSATIKKL